MSAAPTPAREFDALRCQLSRFNELSLEEDRPPPQLPFADQLFSSRHLRIQLDETTDQASRSTACRAAQNAWYLEHLPSREGLSIFHPLCGPGLIARALQHRGLARYVGVDKGPATIAHAKTLLSDQRGFEFICADLECACSLAAVREQEFDVMLLTYEAINLIGPAALGRLLVGLRGLLPVGARVLADFRTRFQPAWQPDAGVARREARFGSLFQEGPHTIIDEWGPLPNSHWFGHRIAVFVQGTLASVYYSFIWLPGADTVIRMFTDHGFQIKHTGRPLLDAPTDVAEAKGDLFVCFERIS